MELFRDAIWQFIGVLISTIALVITIAIFFLQKNKKELTWITLSQSPLLNAKSKDIKVFHNNANVDSVYITEIKIVNTGSIPILPTDYTERIGINFKEDNFVLSAEVTKVEPDTINAVFDIVDNTVLMNSMLLNPKDSINFRLLTKSSYDEFKIIGRIVGIKEIKKQIVEKYIQSETPLIFIGLGTGLLTLGIISLGATFIPNTSIMDIVLIATISGLVFILFAKQFAKFVSK